MSTEKIRNRNRTFAPSHLRTIAPSHLRTLVVSDLRLLPALLELVFPVLCPRPAEVVDIAFAYGSHLRRPAIGTVNDRALHAALHVGDALLGIIEAAGALPRRDRVQRTRERFRIVERRLDRDGLAVGARAKHFDRLQLAAE